MPLRRSKERQKTATARSEQFAADCARSFCRGVPIVNRPVADSRMHFALQSPALVEYGARRVDASRIQFGTQIVGKFGHTAQQVLRALVGFGLCALFRENRRSRACFSRIERDQVRFELLQLASGT